MATLNLTASNKPQELILAYLQGNASDVLVEKINSGTPFKKDGKRLINKKTLDGFMKFAADEARKQAEKGANSACVEDSVVYGWAIHYFEEDTIEDKLYNEDGTEYTPPKPVVKTKPAPKSVEPPKPKQQQASLWDMLETANIGVAQQADDHEVIEHVEDSPTIEEIADKLQQALDEKNGVKTEPPKKELPLFYKQYMDLKAVHPDEIVLERLGDFYEAFDNDAVTLSDELDLTLTGRDVGLESRVPLVGFPYHVSDAYIAKIRKNHGVVIIENTGEIVTLGKTAIPVCKDDLPDEDIEELSETEMREFDGDIQEPSEQDETNETITPPYSQSSFDKETIIYLYELLDGKMDIA